MPAFTGHTTGQADYPHPALGQDFTLSRATPSAASGHLLELIGFPISRSFTTYCVCLELRSLPSTGVTRLQRSYDPVRLPPWPPPFATLRPLPSPLTGLPRFPEPPFQRAVPTTPADRAGARVDCFPAHAAFPNWQEGRHPHCHFRDAMGRGGEQIASIVADLTYGGPNAKAERPEPIPYRPETGQHTDRSDRNEFAELARCRHRAWRRASAVEEACGRRERIAEAAQSLA